MLLFIIVLLVVGFIVGALARLLMPGRDPMGCLGTSVLGIAGSFVGGFLQNLIQYHTLSVHTFHPVGLIGSVIGAWLLLLLLRLTGLERRY
ncbi:MAG TPA: GlsB/YeaQ/YmgE family stress response membrane protein [Trebonia sp.]|nr:GlsB/YeaQ/YmgE family stress response membrane protein [Trebonia sp.]